MLLHCLPHWVNFSVSTISTEVREYYPNISACKSEISAAFNSSTSPAALTHGRIHRTVCDLTYHMLWNSKAAYMYVARSPPHLVAFQSAVLSKKEAVFSFFMFLKLNCTLLIAIKPQKLKKQLWFFSRCNPPSYSTNLVCINRFSGTCGYRQTHQTVLVSAIFVHTMLIFGILECSRSNLGQFRT